MYRRVDRNVAVRRRGSVNVPLWLRYTFWHPDRATRLDCADMNFPTKTRSIIGCPAVIKLCLHQATWSRRSAQAILAFSLACFFAPFTSAQSVNEHVLSTHTSAQLPATLESQGVFGLNDAIRAGEARRRAASGAQTTAPQPLAPEPAYARYPRYQGSIGGVPIRMRLGPKPDERDSVLESTLTAPS
jgi:hypothetical protein